MPIESKEEKNMRKLIVALLIIALLAGGIAVEADSGIRLGCYVRFNYDLKVCSKWDYSYETGTVVVRRSIGYVELLRTDNTRRVWALVRLSEYGEEGNQSSKKGRYWGGWVPSGYLSYTGAKGVNVRYMQGGFPPLSTSPGALRPGYVIKDTTKKNHIKATASVWLHRTYGLSKNYRKALKKGQKVKYRHLIGIDKRGVKFYGVRYEGKNLWVSSKYTKRVK